MSLLKKLFGAPTKQRTMLDDVQEVGGRLISKGYRIIGALHNIAPTAKTTDQKIMEIYSKVSTAFQEIAKQRGEHIPALFLNHIVWIFIQNYEMFGEKLMLEHLQYEVAKYLREGLRQDYKKELSLFDENGNDPDVKRLKELHKYTREKLQQVNLASRQQAGNGTEWSSIIKEIVEQFRERRIEWFATCIVLLKDNHGLRANPRLEGRSEIATWVYQCVMDLSFIAETQYIQPKDGKAFATQLFTALSKDGQQNHPLATELYKLQLAALERNDGSDIMELCSLITEQIIIEQDAFAAIKLAETIPIFTKFSNSVIAQAFGDTAMVKRLIS